MNPYKFRRKSVVGYKYFLEQSIKLNNMEQIKLNHPEWYDFSKGADISEERKQEWIDKMIHRAQLFYRKKPYKKDSL